MEVGVFLIQGIVEVTRSRFSSLPGPGTSRDTLRVPTPSRTTYVYTPLYTPETKGI